MQTWQATQFKSMWEGWSCNVGGLIILLDLQSMLGQSMFVVWAHSLYHIKENSTREWCRPALPLFLYVSVLCQRCLGLGQTLLPGLQWAGLVLMAAYLDLSRNPRQPFDLSASWEPRALKKPALVGAHFYLAFLLQSYTFWRGTGRVGSVGSNQRSLTLYRP